MIGTIRKHSTWLWMIIIVATILSFVVWGTRTGSGDSGRGSAEFGTIAGHKITQDDYLHAQHEVYLRYFLNSGGQWPDADSRKTGFDAERETYFRLMLVQKAEELEIHISNEAVAQMANQILRSMNRGNPLPLEAFTTQVLRPKGLTDDDFERCVRDDLAIQQLISLVGLSGRLVTPQEARELYERENEERSVQAVFFTLSNHLDAVAVTPEAISQFYTNQLPNYRIPERVQVSYVAFEATNFLTEAVKEINEITNLNERLEAVYRERGTNFYSDTKSPEEAKDKILKEEQQKLALMKARKKALAFINTVYDIEPRRAENLGLIAATNGLGVKISEPFPSTEPPAGLKTDATFAREAFKLTVDEPFAGPILGDEAAYIIALNKRLPSESPSLEEVHDRVVSDFKVSSAVAAARQEGQEFYAKLSAGIAAGKSFTSVCTDAKLKPVLPPPIAPGTSSSPEVESHVNLLQFKQAVFNTAVGGLSIFTPTQTGGFIVYVQSKLPVDETVMREKLPKFVDSLRAGMQNEAFQAWFRKEVEQTMRDTPLFQQKPAISGIPKK